MPEYEFMKSAREKEMSDDKYKTLHEEYDKKAEVLSKRIKKLILGLLGIYAASFVAWYIFNVFSGVGGHYTWLIFEFLLAIFLYDPKTEKNNALTYEKNKKILLDSVKSKISMSKIRLGLVIGFGTIFVLLNIYCWWAVFQEISTADTSYALTFIYFM